jgi:uncharacterized protein (DUF736 family)
MPKNEPVGAAWIMEGQNGRYISVELDMGFRGSANLFLFRKDDSMYHAFIRMSGKKRKEVGVAWERVGANDKIFYVLKLKQGIDGEPMTVMVLPNFDKNEASNQRLPDFKVFLGEERDVSTEK